MSQLNFITFAISGRAAIPVAAFEQHFPSSVASLGEEISQQIYEYVMAEELGYFPALEYIRQQACVDDYLLNALEQVSTVALELGRSRIFSLLTPIFSNVAMESIQLISETMPTVRIGSKDALKELAEHFTANKIKFELKVTLIQKHKLKEGLEKAARELVARWLDESFEDLEITSSRKV